MEESIFFLSKNYHIEGLLDKNSMEQGVVISHPHPLYGGDMNNFIVDLIARTYQAGYSFGAWVNALATSKSNFIGNMVMVSPPVGFVDFSPVNSISSLKLVVTGSNDDIAPADRIKTMYPAWNPKAQLEIISGADHFYSGCLAELESVLSSHI